ncbi:MAG: hypothetical protein ACREEQ_10470 [Caulobacteraceae bacterium]
MRVREAVDESFAYFPLAWRGAWAIVGLVAAVAAAAYVVRAIHPGYNAYFVLSYVAEIAAMTAGAGALYRIALERDHPGDPFFRCGPGGLRWGAVEWRLLPIEIVVYVVNLCVAAAYAPLLQLVFTAAARADGLNVVRASVAASAALRSYHWIAFVAGPAGVAYVCVVTPIVLIGVFLYVRLSVLGIAVADLGMLGLRKAWSLTHGIFWPIFGAEAILFGVALLARTTAYLAAVLLARADGHGAAAAALWALAAQVAVSLMVLWPLVAGLRIYIYRRLAHSDAA